MIHSPWLVSAPPAETPRRYFVATHAFPGYTAATQRSSKSAPAMTDVTRILSAIEQGDPHAAELLLPLVYEELRKLAAQKLAQEKPGQTLQATALVHEAYLRLVATSPGRQASPGPEASPGRLASPGRESGEQPPHWDSRGHFFAAA